MPTPLSQLGENAVLGRLLRQLRPGAPMIAGPGDDCAVTPRDGQWDSLLKTDVVAEGIHFTRGTEPERIGRKALARAVSDIAAMGGVPEYALITLLSHPSRSIGSAEGIYRGIGNLAADYSISIAGGETSSLPFDGLIVNVALVGRVEHGQAVMRSTARPGDTLFVSGPLGGSFASGRHLDFEPRIALARRLVTRGPRPTAMMDLSDGLAADLPKLAAACRCGFVLDEAAIPCNKGCSIRQALCDGEDYELLLAFTPDDAAALEKRPELGLYRIGALCEGRGTALAGGWQHFRP